MQPYGGIERGGGGGGGREKENYGQQCGRVRVEEGIKRKNGDRKNKEKTT